MALDVRIEFRWSDLTERLEHWSDRAKLEPSIPLLPKKSLDPSTPSQQVPTSSAVSFGMQLPIMMQAYQVADAPVPDVVRLANVARRFGYRHAARVLFAFAAARNSRDLSISREHWVEISLSDDATNEATVRGQLVSYLIEEIRAQLHRLGARYYAVSFRESDLGDQMMTASVSAKLAEILGLHFLGVVKETAAKQGESGRSFSDEKSWFEFVYGDELAVIEGHASKEIVVPHVGGLDNVLTQLLHVIEEMETPFDTMTFVIGAAAAALLCPFMWDRRGGVLESTFTNNVRNAAYANLSSIQPSRARGQARVVLHIQIGDSVMVPSVKPGSFLVVRAGKGSRVEVETVAETNMPAHSRVSDVPFFLRLAEMCRARFGDSIRLDIVTDGYAHILARLESEKAVSQIDESAGPLFDVGAARINVIDQDDLLRTRMSMLGTLHYGQGPETLVSSVVAIKTADVIVATCGQLSSSVANFLSDLAHTQTIFTFDNDSRFQLNRRRVAVSYLGSNTAMNMAAIFDAISAVDA